MYYSTRLKALNNNCNYHLAAFLRRKGRLVKVGINSMKTHPRYLRKYPDGTYGAHMHAEMDVLRFAQPGDELDVIRYRKCDSSWTMAMPCSHCMDHIHTAGIKKVRYTNWDGNWEDVDIGATHD